MPFSSDLNLVLSVPHLVLCISVSVLPNISVPRLFQSIHYHVLYILTAILSFPFVHILSFTFILPFCLFPSVLDIVLRILTVILLVPYPVMCALAVNLFVPYFYLCIIAVIKPIPSVQLLVLHILAVILATPSDPRLFAQFGCCSIYSVLCNVCLCLVLSVPSFCIFVLCILPATLPFPSVLHFVLPILAAVIFVPSFLRIVLQFAWPLCY